MTKNIETSINELPDNLKLKTIKAWKKLSEKLKENNFLPEQLKEKGKFMEILYKIPSKIKRYQITKELKKLYELDKSDYNSLKALFNNYGPYLPNNYDSKKPIIDLTDQKIKNMFKDLEDFLKTKKEAA
jgi:hypothetical protein